MRSARPTAAWLLLAAGVLASMPSGAGEPLETVERHTGVLAGAGFGLHVAKDAPWHATVPFEVGLGVVGAVVTLRPLAPSATGAVDDYWLTLLDPAGEPAATSVVHLRTRVARLDWTAIERHGWGTYRAVAVCGFCSVMPFEMEVRTRFAERGANVTADDTRLLTPPGEETRTGLTIANTGPATATFFLRIDGLPKKWEARFPETLVVPPRSSAAVELALVAGKHVRPGERYHFDLVVSDAQGELDRVRLEAAYTPELAALRSNSHVVVALIEFGGSGINPYHREFRGGDATAEHPDWFVSAYPDEAQPLALTLDAASYEEAVARDATTWSQVKGDTLYHVEGTRIIGFICFGGCNALDTGGHGTGTASLAAGATLGEAPEALIVSVTGDFFKGARWAARQPWIDVISMSLGPWLGTPTVGVSDPAGAGTGNPYVPFSIPFAQKLAYGSGKRFFTASSQGWSAWANPAGAGAAGPCPYTMGSSFAGSPWTFAVETYWPWTELPWRTSCTPDVVAQGWDLAAASAQSLDGTNAFGNPSGATPQAAGAYARLVYEGRRALGSNQEGPAPVPNPVPNLLGDAVLATGAAGRGPLEDGILTTREAEAAFLGSLEQVDVATSFLRHGEDPRWSRDALPVPAGGEYAFEGWGLVTDRARGLARALVVGEVEAPLRPDDEGAYAAYFGARLAFWEPHVAEEVWVF